MDWPGGCRREPADEGPAGRPPPARAAWVPSALAASAPRAWVALERRVRQAQTAWPAPPGLNRPPQGWRRLPSRPEVPAIPQRLVWPGPPDAGASRAAEEAAPVLAPAHSAPARCGSARLEEVLLEEALPGEVRLEAVLPDSAPGEAAPDEAARDEAAPAAVLRHEAGQPSVAGKAWWSPRTPRYRPRSVPGRRTQGPWRGRRDRWWRNSGT